MSRTPTATCDTPRICVPSPKLLCGFRFGSSVKKLVELQHGAVRILEQAGQDAPLVRQPIRLPGRFRRLAEALHTRRLQLLMPLAEVVDPKREMVDADLVELERLARGFALILRQH